MNGDNADFRELTPLERDAIAWLTRLTSGAATQADAEELRTWRAKSPAHEEAFRVASIAWREAGQAFRLRSTAIETDLGRRGFLKIAAASCGGAVAAASAGIWLGALPSLGDLLADYYTAVGQQERIVLSDGSDLELDADSAIDADFTSDTRSLTLLRGAAYFNAVVDNKREFRVTAGSGTVTANNAGFAVSMGEDDTTVDCLEGQVTVECGRTVQLSKGERLNYTKHDVSEPLQVSPEVAAPWLRGLLIFSDQPLTSVVADLNRYRKGKVIVSSSSIGERRVSGVFHLARPDEVVANLVNSLGLKRLDIPGGIVILS
jgi:transmembrane sensor